MKNSIEVRPEYKRIKWIDQARGLLFLFVILCHSRLAATWIKNIYEPVFLTGFFFLSGYLYNKKTPSDQMRSIFNGLFMPFLFYCVLCGFIGCIQGHSFQRGINDLIFCILGGDQVWFIPCLMLVEVIYFVTNSLVNRLVDVILVFFAVIIFFVVDRYDVSNGIWCWTVSLYAVGFYALGHVCKQHLLSKNLAIGCWLIYLIGCLALGNLGLLDHIDLHQNHYGTSWAFLLTAVVGCFTFISIMQYVPTNKYLVEFGHYTLFLFPFHALVLRQVMKIFGIVGGSFCSSVLILLITFIVCLLVGRVTYKYFPALGGKKKWL